MRKHILLVAVCLLVGTPTLFGGSPHAQAVEAEAQGLALRLTLESSEIPIGQPVSVTLELRNNRPTPVALVVAQGPFDLVVYSVGGDRLWAWTQSRPFPLVPPEQRSVPPGGTVTATLIWDQTILRAPLQVAGKAAPAAYFFEGELRATVADTPTLQLRTSRVAVIIRP